MTKLLAWWRAKAWPWLKKYWYWVLLPVGLLLLLSRRRSGPTAVSTELLDAADVERGAREKADAAVEKAREERDERLSELDEEHAAAVREQVREQQDTVDELRGDPGRLNDFLKDVGADMRK